MKRLIISIVLSVAAISAAVFAYFDIRSTGDRLISSLEICSAYALDGDTDSAGKELEGCIKLWDSSRKRLELYLYSEELFEIDRNFSKIKKLLDTGDVGELEMLIGENIDDLERMAENQSPSLGRVF